MNRDLMLSSLRERNTPWDVIVIGGGATGLGTALDAAARGYDVILFEGADFAKGTSSRSTKLVHGGVRYLQQGNVGLVMEALKERGLLLQNAPHLVKDVPFIVPSYSWWESPFYGLGLKVYDLLAGKYGFGKSSHLSREEVIEAIPSIKSEGLLGGTRYFDGQFDDARLAINLAATLIDQGGMALNYCEVTSFLKDDDGVITGLTVRDHVNKTEISTTGRVVINATGPFTDKIRVKDRAQAKPLITASQGVHIVLDRSFLPCTSAIMVPHTDDGRVMFAIPWYDVTVVGTTDTPIEAVDLEPVPLPEEIDFILENANRYLARPATHDDIKSVFAGIRPLVTAGEENDTSTISREHSVIIDPESGLITAAGGKWTTYRKMAEDVIDHAMTLADLEPKECQTKHLAIHGSDAVELDSPRLAAYGSDAMNILGIEKSHARERESIHSRLPLSAGEIRWACRSEMALRVDDVLARRSRCLLFDAAAAIEAAPRVAAIMAEELGRDSAWEEQEVAHFRSLASRYLCQHS